MKPIYIFALLLAVTFLSCDTVIHPTLQSATPVYIVDAFINNKPDTQVIRVTYSQPYFEETVPPGVSGASVVVTDNDANLYTFAENPKEKGAYIWVPSTTPLGRVGNHYMLVIKINNENLLAQSTMGRVPPIDSITFQANDRNDGTKEFYRAQFWAVDLRGPGDTYWIKTYKNGMLLNKPEDLNLAYDAAFSKGSNFDGYTFIQPIRNGINPNDTDANDKRLSPYSLGDSVYVEIHSLNEATFDFLNQVAVQTNRPGGFSELFARPLANVSTNIFNENAKGTNVQGFFNVGSVSGMGKKFVSIN
jgi:Domain of unknown function (DUF4249)